MIYLDNAATTGKKPESVINAVKYSLYNLSANPGRSGHKISNMASELVYDTRKIIAETFNCDDIENVVFTQNCSHAVNIVLKGVLEKGDNVIISDMEHNAVMRPLTAIRADYSPVNISLYDDRKTLENIENTIKDNTKMIFLTAASNVIGKILPLKEIGEIAKKHNLMFGVDAAQAAGVIPIDMKEMNIDFLCIAAHKGLYAPMGTGVLIARKPIYQTIIEGGTGTESINFSQPESMPERLESGTVNLPGIAGIKAGVTFINSMGDKIYSNELKYIQKIYEYLSLTNGVKLYTPYPEKNLYAPVLSFNVEGLNSQTVADLLNEYGIAVRAGLHCAPTIHKKLGTIEGGTVRISTGAFNKFSELPIVRESIKKICENRKKYIDMI